MTRSIIVRWAVATCLAAGLIGPNLGCQQATTSATSANTSRTNTAPDKKNDGVKPPKADPG
jgi:hypothetical protein